MRRAFLLGVLGGLLLPAGAHAATLTLLAEPGVARYGQSIAFSGALAPAQGGAQIGLYVADGGAWRLVAPTATAADGTYRVTIAVHAPLADHTRVRPPQRR